MNKKKILFITTGGTIASVRTPQGLRPVLSSGELLAHMPGLAGLCQPDTLALCSIDSTDMSPDRKSTRLNSSHHTKSRMPSSA